MKKAFVKELQASLLGSVTDNPDALGHFTTDSSVFQSVPGVAIYPANTADLRKTVKFAAEKTAAGKPVQLTARGLGAGESGASLGEAAQVVFPAHFNKLLRLDRDTVTVQPGISYRTLQQTLHTHMRWVPVFPASTDYATVGGAVAENSAGIHSVKYGATRGQITSMKVVLADGSLIQTKRIGARELNRRKGHTDFEGEIYRKLDSLILDHEKLIRSSSLKLPYHASGYGLEHVRRSDGSFDLGQIFIGSEGTLGLLSEVTLSTHTYNPRTTLVVGYFASTYAAIEASRKLAALKPSALELADRALIESVFSTHPGYLDGLLPGDDPATVLLLEFNQASQFSQRLSAARAERLIIRAHGKARIATDPVEQMALWKLKQSSALFMEHTAGTKRALPFIEAALVPTQNLAKLLEHTTKLLGKYDLTAAVWGHVGDGNLSFVPRLDLAKKKDADKLINLSNEYAEMVATLGGTTSGTAGDGLMRGHLLAKTRGEELAELFASVKHIFDPHSIFAPMQKTQGTMEYVKSHLRSEFVNTSKHNHLLVR